MRKVRGALITIRCDCGGVGYVPYGERWECGTCHRRWNTGQIPAEEYWGIMRDMRRLRITVMVTALALVVPVLALVPFAGTRILILLPVIMGFWFFFYMPRWRRRVREQARSLRRWNLRPE
jgi:fatty acid desaturase